MTSRRIDAGGAVFALDLKDNITKKLATVEKRIKGAAQKAASIGNSIANVGQRLAGVGTAVAAFGATGLAGFAKATLAAGDFAETVSKFETVFADQASAVRTWAQSFSKQVGRSEADIVRFLSTAQDTFVPLGFDPQEAKELSKRLTTLSVDLASFNNISDGEAFDRLISAVVGNTENLRAFGVVAQDAQIKAEALAQGFDPKALTPYQKALSIVSLTMKGTQAAQGDAIRTAGSFNNRVKALTSSIADLTNAVGGPLLGPVTRIVEKITQATSGITAFVKANSEIVKRVALVTAAITGVGAAIAAMGVTIAGVGYVLTGIAATVAAVTTAMSVAGSVLAGAFTIAVSPIGLVVAGLGAAVFAVGKFSGSLEGIKSAFSALPQGVMASIERIQTALSNGGVAQAAKQLKDELSRVGEIAALQLQISWKKAFDFIKRLGEESGRFLVNAFTATAKAVAATLQVVAGAMDGLLLQLAKRADAITNAALEARVEAQARLQGKDIDVKFNFKTFENRVKGAANLAGQAAEGLGDRIQDKSQEFQKTFAAIVDAAQDGRETELSELAARLAELSKPIPIEVDTGKVKGTLTNALTSFRNRVSAIFADPVESENVSNVSTPPSDKDGKALTSTSAELAENAAAFAPSVDIEKATLNATKEQTQEIKSMGGKVGQMVSAIGALAANVQNTGLTGLASTAGAAVANGITAAQDLLSRGVQELTRTEFDFANGPAAREYFRFLDDSIGNLSVPPVQLATADLSGAVAMDDVATEDTQQQMAKSLANIDRKTGRRRFGA